MKEGSSTTKLDLTKYNSFFGWLYDVIAYICVKILKESLICVLEKAYVMLIKVVMVLAIILKDTISNGRL